MRKRLFLACGLFVLALAVAGAFVFGPHWGGHQAQPSLAYREIAWPELVPKDWDPLAGLRREEIAGLRDADPRARDLLRQMREAWLNAPAVPALAGQAVRIPGYVVPLDATRDEVREFLLVPYFGACIHVPPPPPNQVIHVVMAEPAQAGLMAPVWVSGVLRVETSETPFGPASYRMEGQGLTPYTPPAASASVPGAASASAPAAHGAPAN